MKKSLSKRSLLRSFFRFLFRTLAHVDVQGLEHIPAVGGAILAANHMSLLDAPLGFSLLERDDITALVADKHQKTAYLRWIVNAANGIWINREDADLQAIRAARAYLTNGGMLGIAPEGTRSRSGALGQAKNGVAYLADKAGVPIIPLAFYGTEDGFSQLAHLRRPRLFVRFGPPFSLPPLERRERDAALQRNTDEIMCQIAALLPEKYHGFYRGHPRLKELLDLP